MVWLFVLFFNRKVVHHPENLFLMGSMKTLRSVSKQAYKVFFAPICGLSGDTGPAWLQPGIQLIM